MPMLMRQSPLALEKISGFPSLWPSPIFVKIFSWVVSQAIGVLKPQKLSRNYSPNHSMVRLTTRTITSPCLSCLQSMGQGGLDMNISSGDLPSNPPNTQTHPWIIPRIMASRLLRDHTSRVKPSQASLPNQGPWQDLSQQFASSVLRLMPLPPHLLPLTRFLALMTLVPHGSPGDTTNWIYGGHIDLQSLPSMNSMKEKQNNLVQNSGGSSEIQMEGIWQLCFCSCPSKKAWDS